MAEDTPDYAELYRADEEGGRCALVAAAYERAAAEMHKAVVGQDGLIEALMLALLANGHVLLEGVPGTAKTLAVRAFSRICRMEFARVQFTPDLMPSDVIGTNVFDPRTAEFRLRKGPVFAGVLLADEVNRTPPKTQAALLEAMEERAVTIDGVRHQLPEPFLVCATQNPIEFEGTYPLPEAQVDRFMLKVIVDYPSPEDEHAILLRYQEGFRATDLDATGIEPVLDLHRLRELRACADSTTVTAEVRSYIAAISRTCRASRHALLGPSPRATISLMLAAKARAAISGTDYVTPDDVKAVAPTVLRHRFILRPESEMEGVSADYIVQSVLESVEVPR